MKLKDYAGPMGVVVAAILGFSMLCAVSGMALSDPSVPTPAADESLNILDVAISNANTAAALTVGAITELVSTPTITPTNTATITPSSVPTDTPTIRVFPTRIPPTRTRRPIQVSSPTQINTLAPTRTNIPVPTRTYTVTSFPTEPPTNTPEPPTATQEPPTATEPPTDTPEPPTATEPPTP